MQSAPTPQEPAAHPLQGPHQEPCPTGFVPMRLTLLPAGPSIDLTKPEMLVGRHSSADVRLALPDVSRRHCRFCFQHGSWKVIDLDSLNGVFVNDERMHEAVLYEGDQVRLGSFAFRVHMQVPQLSLTRGSGQAA